MRDRASAIPNDPDADICDALVQDGFAGPLQLLTQAQAHFLARHLMSLPENPPVWTKSFAAVDPLVHGIAANPKLLSILRKLLGEDIVVWGASPILRKPGEMHFWHSDIESCAPSGGFVSVWIGLLNTQAASALKFLRGSHLYGVSLQEMAARHGIERHERDDEAAFDLAKTQSAKAEIALPECADGEALIFDGRVWHGSRNDLSNERRISLLLQYARSDVAVNIPDYGDLNWPFRFRRDIRPPVIPVSGRAMPETNVVAQAPSLREDKTLQPSVHPIDRRLRCADGVPYASVPCFLGRTPNVDYLESHYSVLMPGHSPHPPHMHLDEEILVVMNGSAELVVPPAHGAEPEIFPASAGTTIYYPPYQLHTIRNTGDEPVSYAMLRWKSGVPGEARPLTPQMLQASWVGRDAIPGPIAMKTFVEGPTAFLGKLHAHITRIRPGAGYEAHRDEHDVTIFLIEGEIRVMGKHIAAPSVVFLPGGCLHDMKGMGASLAKYLVWEFHRAA